MYGCAYGDFEVGICQARPFSRPQVEQLILNAASRGHDLIVKLLLKPSEVDINCRIEAQDTALLLSARHDSGAYVHIIKLLLNHPDIITELRVADGTTVLIKAIQLENVKMISELLQKCDIL